MLRVLRASHFIWSRTYSGNERPVESLYFLEHILSLTAIICQSYNSFDVFLNNFFYSLMWFYIILLLFLLLCVHIGILLKEKKAI